MHHGGSHGEEGEDEEDEGLSLGDQVPVSTDRGMDLFFLFYLKKMNGGQRLT